MDHNKKILAVNAFFITQFNYCPLLWMFHNRNYSKKKKTGYIKDLVD